MFRILREDGTVELETPSCTKAMKWLVDKASTVADGYVYWFEPDGEENTIITLSIAGVYYKLRKVQ